MSDLMTWLFGGANDKPREYKPLPPEPWPTADEVRAAREYKKKYGNFNEQMIEGAVAPNKYDERQQYRTGIPHTATAQILPAQEALAYIKQNWGGPTPGLLSPEAADRLYAAQIAAQRNPLAALGFDPQRIVHVPDHNDGFNSRGAYQPSKDQIFLLSDSATTPVHESLHRGIEQLSASNPAAVQNADGERFSDDEEESIVRRGMKNAYGDAELNTYNRTPDVPPQHDMKLPVELMKAYGGGNAKVDNYIKQLNAAANLLLAQRILARQGGVPW